MNAVIWTKPGCNWCVRAKRLLTNEGYDVREIIVDGTNVTHKQMIVAFDNRNLKTYPQISIDNEYIGGYDDLVWWLEEERSLD